MTKEEFAQLLSGKAGYAEQLEMIIANAKDSGLLVVYNCSPLRRRGNGSMASKRRIWQHSNGTTTAIAGA